MKIHVVLEIDMAAEGEVGKALREKALLVFKGRKHRLENNMAPPPEEYKEALIALNKPVEEGILAFLKSGEYKFVTCNYDTKDVVSAEEEAAILAPPG